MGEINRLLRIFVSQDFGILERETLTDILVVIFQLDSLLFVSYLATRATSDKCLVSAEYTPENSPVSASHMPIQY